MEKPIDLEELIPSDSILELNEKIYVLRKITLEDEVWLKNLYGQKVQTIFTDEDMDAMARLAFRLMKDKSDFLPIEEEGYDDEGRPKKLFVSGPQRLLRSIVGMKDKQKLMWAIFKTFGISRPEVTEEVQQGPKA